MILWAIGSFLWMGCVGLNLTMWKRMAFKNNKGTLLISALGPLTLIRKKLFGNRWINAGKR